MSRRASPGAALGAIGPTWPLNGLAWALFPIGRGSLDPSLGRRVPPAPSLYLLVAQAGARTVAQAALNCR